MGPNEHCPVLLAEAIDALNVQRDETYIDCTFGRGGHSREILKRLGKNGRVLAFDRDPDAIAAARMIAALDNRLEAIQSCFSDLGKSVEQAKLSRQISGVLFDLGVSTPQLRTAHRGFSFQHDGPLDMRMDPGSGQTAAEWLASATVDEIAQILRDYGELKGSRRLARRICKAREQKALTSTGALAQLMVEAIPRRRGDLHPATKVFQAIRIHINGELQRLENGLHAAVDALAPKGRVVVISFHSLEDRIVKRFMRDSVRGDAFPPRMPVTADLITPKLFIRGRAQRPSSIEIDDNPQARSAVLRVAERTA